MSQCETPQTVAAHCLPSSGQAMSPDELINGISGLFPLGDQNAFYCDILLQNTGFLGCEEVCQFHGGGISRDLIIASLHVA
jgi:hypothetical protein